MKWKNTVVNIVVTFIVAFILWIVQENLLSIPVLINDLISWVHRLPNFWKFFFKFILSIGLSILLVYLIDKVITGIHFKKSFPLVRHMHKAMKNRINILNKYSREENEIIDSYIQSPIEYAKEVVEGNQTPKFEPDATYQDILYDGKIRYIVAITAENPNMFLDPTIGFYMSNCYAASIIRQTNDYIKKSKDKTIYRIPQLCVRDLEELEDDVNEKRQKIVEKLKGGNSLDDFEFIRIFMFDEHQGKCCDNAVFPSLKASQDLFRTISFYIQKEKLKNSLNSKGKWGILYGVNEYLWKFFDQTCKLDPRAREVQKRRIKDVIPEFLFVFYEDKIGVHTYLGGTYCKKLIRYESDDGAIDNINKLIKLLASYVDDDKDKGQLVLGEEKNVHNTFIDWKWIRKRK